MNEQDKRAVESLCLCGMDFETICRSFSGFPHDELKVIYDEVKDSRTESIDNKPSVNCS